MSEPKIVCAGCGQAEVGIYSPLCRDCLAAAKQAELDARREAEFREEMRRDAFGGRP